MQNTTLFALFQNTKSDNCSWTWRLPSRMQQNPLSKLWFVTHIVKFGLSAIGLRVRYCSLGADNSAFPVSLYSELREVFTKTPSHWHRSPSPNYSFFVVVVVGFFFLQKAHNTTAWKERRMETYLSRKAQSTHKSWKTCHADRIYLFHHRRTEGGGGACLLMYSTSSRRWGGS